MTEPLGPPHRRLRAPVLVGDHCAELCESAHDGRSATPRGLNEGYFPGAGFVVYVGAAYFHEGSDRFHVTSETFFKCTARARNAGVILLD